MLSSTFSVIFFALYIECIICIIYIVKFSDVLPVFACVSFIGKHLLRCPCFDSVSFSLIYWKCSIFESMTNHLSAWKRFIYAFMKIFFLSNSSLIITFLISFFVNQVISFNFFSLFIYFYLIEPTLFDLHD